MNLMGSGGSNCFSILFSCGEQRGEALRGLTETRAGWGTIVMASTSGGTGRTES